MPVGGQVAEKGQSPRTAPERSSPRQVSLGVDEALHFALRLHRAGSLSEAETLYRRILAVTPENLNALHFLGLLCHQQDRKTEAVELIERIIALDPQNADAHNNLGNVLEGLGKGLEAEACYRRAIALRPDHAPAHNNLGVVLMAQRRVAEAVEAYRRAVALAPDSADFHYNLGNALRRSGNLEEAVVAYRKAVALKPEHAGARRGLARTLIRARRLEEAAGVYDEWLRADPGNPVVLYLRAACLGQGAPDRAPDAYVEQVFDDMADSFDAHLVENLDYRAPDLLGDALSAALPPPASSLDVLDAGCGTGLCAPHLRPYARRLIGVDLSAGMLARAAGRQVYDDLVQAELTTFLDRQSEAFDVIASADTLCYFGALEPVVEAAAKALKSGGLLAFTSEDVGDDGPGFQLQPHGRYAHAKRYVEGALGAAGLVVHSIASVVLRKEGGHPVAGHLVVAKKQPGVR
jgi:predicted TPR repeat methyltransferase